MHTATASSPRADSTPADRGRDAEKPTDIPARGWKEIAHRTWNEASDDNVGIVAAGVAFYGFLALVPLLGSTVLIYGLVADPQAVVRHASSLTAMLPQDVATLIGEQLMNLVQTSGGKKGLGLLIALAISLWGARNAAGAIITALNIAYEEEEDRGFVKTTLLAIGMTVGAVLLAILAGGAIALLGYIQEIFPQAGPAGAFFFNLLTYLLLGAIAAAAAATLFRYGPARENAKWSWLTPGSILFAVAWIVLTLGFGFYVSNFGNYGATYGSLSAIIVLLTWMYLSSYVLLFAGELNSEIEHQTARDTTDRGRKPIGQRGAWAADHVAAGSSEPEPTGSSEQPPSRPKQAAHNGSPAHRETPGSQEPSRAEQYAVSRATSRAGRAAGLRKIGMVSSALATAGLALLRRRGREGAGAALLATAAAISLLKRDH